MDPSTLLLLSLLTPLGSNSIEGDRDLVRPTTDYEWFKEAVHGNTLCLDFEGLTEVAGQAGAVRLRGTEFPGVTITLRSTAPWGTVSSSEGLFVGIPDPALGANDTSFFADDFTPVSGEAVLSTRLTGTPHGQLVLDFAHPVMGVGGFFLDVEGPGSRIEVFDGPQGTGNLRGSIDVSNSGFAGVTTWYIHSAVITLGSPTDGVGIDDLCFENPYQVKNQETFLEHLEEYTCIDFEGVTNVWGDPGTQQISGTRYPGLTMLPQQYTSGLFVFNPLPGSPNFVASSGHGVLITNRPPTVSRGVVTINFDEPWDAFGAYFTDVEDRLTQIELFGGRDAVLPSLGKARWTNNQDTYIGVLGEDALSVKFWLGGYGDGVALDDMCYGRRYPSGCRVHRFESYPNDAEPEEIRWRMRGLGDAAVASWQEVDGTATVTGTGSELYHGDDHAAFLHQAAGGDFRIEMDIVSEDGLGGHAYRKGGVMVRESLDADAPRVMVQYLPDFPDPIEPGPALQFDARLAPGGPFATLASTVKGISLPVRVAVERTGNQFSVFYSTDAGATWIHPGGSLGGSALIPMSQSVLVGPAVASYDASRPFTMAFDNVALCEMDSAGGPEPPPPSCPRDSDRPLDWVYLLDLSSTMEASHGSEGGSPGAVKRQSTAQALAALHDVVDAQGAQGPSGGRVALVSYAGGSDPAQNLAGGAQIVTGFTSSLDLVGDELQALIDGEIVTPELKTTPAALGLRKVLELVLAEADPYRDVAVVWATDNLPNIDDEGRGPDAYTVDELQALELGDGFGAFLSPDAVALQGQFNAIGSFDGEVVADAMAAVLDLRSAHENLRSSDQSLRIFSLVPRGDGVSTPIYSEQLLDFAAWSTGGSVYGGTSAAELVAAVSPLLDDAFCGDPGSTTLSGVVWHDLDGDGVRDPGEPGLPGVELTVGEIMVWTDAAGIYQVTVPSPSSGQLSVQVNPQTLPAGLDPTADPDGLATPHGAQVAAPPWTVIGALDFGYGPSGASCTSDAFDQPTVDGRPGAAWILSPLGNADQIDADVSAGTLKLTGDGTSAYAGADHAAFLHQSVEGDFRLEVDVLDFPVDAGGTYRKAGLMVRAGLDEWAPRIMVQVVSDFAGRGPALQFRARTVDGGPGDIALGSNLFGIALPVRLAVEQADGVYSVYFSTDGGSTWRQPAGGSGGSLAMDLGARPLAGLNVVSYAADTTLTAEFDNFVAHCDVGGGSCAPTAAGLVGWWSGDGHVDDRAGDLHGTPLGGVDWRPGLVSDALWFDGIDDGVALGPDPRLAFADGPFTVEGWIRPEDFSGAGGCRWIFTRHATDDRSGWRFGTCVGFPGPGTHLIYRDRQTGVDTIAPISQPAGEWMHVAAVRRGTGSGELELYLQGERVATGTSAGRFDGASNAYIGRLESPPFHNVDYFHGLIDELAVYGRALDATELGAVVDAGMAGKCGPSMP